MYAFPFLVIPFARAVERRFFGAPVQAGPLGQRSAN
jgi:hypothetical protein